MPTGSGGCVLGEEWSHLAVPVGVELEVVPFDGLALGHDRDEMVLAHQREGIVVDALLTDGGLCLGGEVLAAR